MNKDDAINTMKISKLNEKVDYCKYFLLYTKLGETTYYKKIEKQY